ncbi:nuclear valosin-containing protein-like isoform X2 [Aethina tumida]|uniref:nuclear valosin-containing protein-like isoform X2 n=1 Tax=Aethina tumida TaxID=116153 RepID=UPI0021474B77|nr:nuclear valosin-containing protein-like isoform X2 [Aethina tumida]
MGKIHRRDELEIIPLTESIQNRRSIQRKRLKMQRTPYMSDPSILPRVQKYLESNLDKNYVDINAMADELQSQYREYAKRKRSAFRAAVKKAYSVVLNNYGNDDNGSTEDDDDDDEEEDLPEDHRYNNTMNSQLMNLYNRSGNRPQTSRGKEIEDSELIVDISSDDDSEKTKDMNSTRPPNGASTSHMPCFPAGKRVADPEPLEIAVNPYEMATRKRKFENSSLNSNNQAQTNNIPNAKKKKGVSTLEKSSITFKDVGGMNRVLEDVCKLLLHMKHPELYKNIGISPPRGFLLHGPPGTGKTLLANAIAGELNIPLLKVAAPELVAGVSGESEERIRELFDKAMASSPCILFIDEIDAITQNRQNAQKEMERRIVAQLLTCLDDLGQNELGDRVLVVGATNRPDSIDPALRRAGRFDREICLGIPDVASRAQILKVLTRGLKLAENFDMEAIAKYTPGYVGADLLSLTREAAMSAVNRVFNEIRETRKLLEAQQSAEPTPVPTEVTNDLTVNKVGEDNDSAEGKDGGVSNDSSKSDAELQVVVDDETSKDECVVVVSEAEDGGKKVPSPSTSTTVNVVDDKDDRSSVIDVGDNQQEPMPVDTVVKDLSPLEELISWLHDKRSLSPAQLHNLYITMEDFGKALKCVQPSAKREGFATVPDTTWADVGSLNDVREELQMAILGPVRHAEQFEALGVSVPTGVLLCGPPGCGKTLLAKAIANEAGINFISVKGPELLNMYVGESERAVRVCFERARNSAPCVIFFDELDALCPKRSDSREGGATMRVVNQMLTEMDGVEGRRGVFLLAASNRPDIIDPAVLRPGRLDKIIFVGLPTGSDRVDILRAITKEGTRPQLAPDVDLTAVSETCQGYTGADLAALVREAGVEALKEFMLHGDSQQPLMVGTEHFKKAVAKIRPSVSEKDQKHYDKLRKVYAAVPVQTEVEEMEYT